MKRLVYRVLIILIILLFIIYILGWFIPIKQFVLKYARENIKEQLEIDLTVNKIEGNLFYHLILNDIELGDIAKIKRIELAYNPLSIISKRFRILNLEISQPNINIEEVLKIKTKERERTPLLRIDIESFVLDSGKILYKEKEIPVSLNLKFIKDRFDITDLSINLPHSTFFTSGNYELDGNVELLYKLNLELSDLNLGDGTILSKGEISGRGTNPIASGELEYSSIKIAKISTQYHYKDKNIYLRELIISDNNFYLSGNALFSLNLQKGNISLSGNILDEELKIDGNYNEGLLNANISGGVWNFSLNGNIEEDVLLEISGNYKQQPISGQITYQTGKFSGGIEASSLSLIEELNVYNLLLEFDFNFTDDIQQGKATISINDILYSDNNLGNIIISIDLKNDTTKINTSGIITGYGFITLKRPNPFSFTFSMTDFNFSKILPELTGVITLNGETKGLLSEPKKVTANLIISDFYSIYKGININIPEPINMNFVDSKFTIPPSKFLIDNSEIVLSGEFTDRSDVKLKTEGFALNIFNNLLPYHIKSGDFDANIHFYSFAPILDLFGDIRIIDAVFVFHEDTIGPIDIKLNLEKNTITIDTLKFSFDEYQFINEDSIIMTLNESSIIFQESKIKINDALLSFSGLIPIDETNQFDFQLSTTGFNLKILNIFFPDLIGGGNLNTDFRILGGFKNPRILGKTDFEKVLLFTQKEVIGPINLNINFDQNSILINKFNCLVKNQLIENIDPIFIELYEKSAKVESAMIKLGNRPFIFYGIIPFTSEPNLNLSVKTDSLNLSIISPMLPGINLDGFLSLEINIKGNFNKPEILGNAIVNSIFVNIDKDTIGPINGYLEFSEDYIQLPELSIIYNQGKVLINGNLGLDKKASLTMTIRKTIIPIMNHSKIGFDADLQLTSNIDSLIVTGEILITGSYNEPIEIQLINNVLNRVNRPPQKPPDFLKGIYLDIGSNIDFTINNNAANIVVDGDLQIVGTVAKPGITGLVKLKEGGRIGYLGRDFYIEHGNIDFIDPLKISPNLDILSNRGIEYQGVDYLITLLITGPPDKINIEINSEPILPAQEIIALIITGKIRGTQVLGTQGIGEKAIAFMVDKMKGRVEEQVARSLGLEKVKISGSIINPALLRLGAEKRFLEKLRVSYTSGFENWKQQQIGLDYEINRNLSIYSIYDLENRDTGAGFDFHLKLW